MLQDWGAGEAVRSFGTFDAPSPLAQTLADPGSLVFNRYALDRVEAAPRRALDRRQPS
jgi:hypothetical protein